MKCSDLVQISFRFRVDSCFACMLFDPFTLMLFLSLRFHTDQIDLLYIG